MTGILLLLPFIAWATTAVFFLIRPAYEQAYEQLRVRQLPVTQPFTVLPSAEWEEVRLFRTVLGNHLIAREGSHWRHLNADTLEPWVLPDSDELKRLVEDAFSANPARYGQLLSIENNTALTDTGVQISINWETMSLYQTGRDTYWINKVYDIHYLRWTGYRPFDNVFGLFGLFLLMYMSYSGASMAFGRR